MQKPFEVKGVRFGEDRPVVCVPVVERERAGIVDRISTLVDKKIRMIEWRADFYEEIDRPEAVRGILEDIRPLVDDTVLLFTLRTKNQGGETGLDEKEILYRNETAARSGAVDMIDLEYFELTRPEREIRRYQQMGVRVISSHHDFDSTPDDVVLHMVTDQLQKGGGDIVKLAVMPNSVDDLIRLLKLTDDTRLKYPGLPIVMIAMGNLGVVTRITGEVFGSCITFGADGRTSAPGQMQADTLAEVLDALHESMTAGR